MSIINATSFHMYYSELFDKLKLQIVNEKDDYIITQPVEDLVKYYLNQAFTPVEFDLNREETLEHEKYVKTIYSHERERGYQGDGDLLIECEKIILRIPIRYNKDTLRILQLRNQTFSFTGIPQFSINANNIIVEIEIKGYGISLTNEQISNSIQSIRTEIQSIFESKKNEVTANNSKLEESLAQFILERKNKLDEDKKRMSELVNLIKIPLARKDNENIKQIQIEKKTYVSKVKPKTFEEDYQLDREKVLAIIKLMNNQCLQFEKNPKTYVKLDEPNLRDLLLSNLNSIFEGQATGETFNNKGKTDIYLNIDKGNILIAECKFYGGEILYRKTIDQLLGYLTWRQNYGIMITFCKQKNFSKIINDAEVIIKSHNSYESGYKILSDSHFISRHTLPGDEYKYVEIHHLYYNMYTE